MGKLSLFSFFFLAVSQISLAQAPLAFWSPHKDICTTSPAGLTRGTLCAGGSIFAGEFDSGYYMITPSGCTDSATPTCAGGEDTVEKTWRGTSGTSTDLATLENIGTSTITSSSAFRGEVTTPAITAHVSTSSDSAADFCADMSYGGFNDWTLPAKSELAYIYCHSDADTHDTSRPQEDTNCTTYGGKTAELTGFAADYYWSSSEQFNANAWYQNFDTGHQTTRAKNGPDHVRCVRRY